MGPLPPPHKRAKAVQPIIDKVLTLAKKGDLHAIRQIARLIYNQYTGGMREDVNNDNKLMRNTVLRTILRDTVLKVATRKSGYTRLVPLPPRKGDATPMAYLQLIEDSEVAVVSA
jgi:large subunit ribosomal protein L17